MTRHAGGISRRLGRGEILTFEETQRRDAEIREQVEADRQKYETPFDDPDAETVEGDQQPNPDPMTIYSIRMPRDLLRRVSKLAKARRATSTSLIRQFIERGLEEEESGDVYERLSRVEKALSEMRESQAAYATAMDELKAVKDG